MTLSRTLLFSTLLLTLVGCPKKEDDDTEEAEPKKKSEKTSEPAPTPAPTPTPTQTTQVKVDNPGAQPGIEPRVKAEVDQRTDGVTGTTLAVTGAKATLQTVKEWQSAKQGDFTVAGPADKKVGLAAGNGGVDKADAAAAAMGLTACKWNPPENVAVGKDKLPGSAADGTCTKGTIPVKAAVVALTGENLLVVGAWEPDGDAANMFGAMRSIAKAAGGGGGLAACCAALQQNAKSAPPQQQGAYLLAAGACKSAMSNPNTAQALAAVRAAAGGVGLPASCK
jgi:hypothetical protein